MDEPIKKILLRLPESLHAAVAAEAKREHRSLTGQIICALEEHARSQRASERQDAVA